MRSGALKAATIVEIISAIFGFWGGIPLLIDPSGGILGLDINLIASLPIKNFISNELIIFCIVGKYLEVLDQ